jgi:formylglycine-generating enzyme required for sulfatase activity
MKQIMLTLIIVINIIELMAQDVVLIKGGQFQMGCLDSICDSDEAPIHIVRLTDFYLSKYEVTYYEYCNFLNAHLSDSSGLIKEWININGKGNDNCKIYKDSIDYKVEAGFENHPVVFVSWFGAKAYCDWKGFRLPTEAEWEYAAKSGKEFRYCWGNGNPTKEKGGNIGDETLIKKFNNPDWRIWNGYTDGYATSAPVGSFVPNEFGLFDMTGNVSEWCADFYNKDYYKISTEVNPQGPETGETRVLRDGAWGNAPESIRTTNRTSVPPNAQFWLMGFRVAKDTE